MAEPGERGSRDAGSVATAHTGSVAPSLEAALPPVEPGELEAVRRVFVCFGKTARIIQLYPSNNSLFVEATNELHSVFERFLAEHGELALDIEECRFMYKGRPMHEEPVRSRSIPFRLYVDGIRRITFAPGVTREELLSLLEVLGHPPPAEDSEDDMVTLLWEKEFQHFHYFVLDLDTTEEPPHLDREVKPREEAESQEGAADAEGGEARPKKPPRVLPPEVLKRILPVSEQDVKALHDMVEAERCKNLRHDLTTLLFELLSLHVDPEGLRNVIGILGLLLRSFVRAGEIGDGLEVLKRLQALETSTADEEQKGLIRDQLAQCSGRDVIDALAAVLEKPGQRGAREVMEFLDLLGPPAIPALIDVVHRIADEWIARQIVLRIARADPEPLIARLSAPDPEVVRRIVAAIGATAEPALAEWLLPLLGHDRSPVRVEVLRSLARLGGDKARSGIVRCLADPDRQVRLQATRAVAEAGETALLPGILAILESREFQNRDFLERQEMYKAVARVGRNAAVPYLTRVLDESGWFNRGRRDQQRACAASALGCVATPEARMVVAERLESSRGLVLEALRVSLRRIDEALRREQKDAP